jgi:mannose-1-phosphate guanylyltransferase/mannose-6-phosphate isomerase
VTAAVILAGGQGTRLWPLARSGSPKPFLPLDRGVSLFRRTYDRISPVVGRNRILVVTGLSDGVHVRRQVPELPHQHVLIEEISRDTACAIGLAAHWLRSRYDDAIMVVLPADHAIRPATAFASAIRRAVRTARVGGRLVTFGVRPRSADSGFGYIRPEGREVAPGVRRATAFVEKPAAVRAARMIRSGFLWNSGIFVWRASAILEALARHRPAVARPLAAWARRAPGGRWRIPASVLRRVPRVPIDRAVLERSPDVVVLRAPFTWSDVGNWDTFGALVQRSAGDNAGMGRILALDARGCVGANPGGLTVFVGVENIAAIRSGDAVLVCRRGAAQHVRDVVRRLSGRLAVYR